MLQTYSKDQVDALLTIKAADGANVNTAETTASTSYADLATGGPAVTLTTGTSVIVTISATLYRNAVGAGSTSWVSVAVSGATTIAASDNNGFFCAGVNNGYGVPGSRRFKLTGLTPGSNTFTLKYKNAEGVSFGFGNRSIVVEAL